MSFARRRTAKALPAIFLAACAALAVTAQDATPSAGPAHTLATTGWQAPAPAPTTVQDTTGWQ